MVKKLVITRPAHDPITSYLNYFCKETIKKLKLNRDIHLTNLEGKNANKKEFENSMKREDPELIFLNGHGDEDTVRGYKNEIILDKSNINITKNKIVYALACNSLQSLGEKAVNENGTKTYIGYRGTFSLVIDKSRSNTPEKDKNAEPFKKACATMFDSLMAGETISTSIENTKEEYIKSIRTYGTSKDDPYGDAPLIRFALTWNLEFLDAIGDLNARF